MELVFEAIFIVSKSTDYLLIDSEQRKYWSFVTKSGFAGLKKWNDGMKNRSEISTHKNIVYKYTNTWIQLKCNTNWNYV